MTKKILVTGGAGFIGSNFIDLLLQDDSFSVTNIDVLTYAGKMENMHSFVQHPNYRFFPIDIANREELNKVFDQNYDAIVHFAAESHVDRSILEPSIFLQTNIIGTNNLLSAVVNGYAEKMIYVSTDEVYGSLREGEPPFTEKSPLAANNPYSASKAGADLLVRAFHKTYSAPVITTRCSNNYGPRQDKEKLISKTIAKAFNDEKIPIYGDGMQIRDWLFVEDHCKALSAVLQNGKVGEVYNIGGGNEQTNLDVVKQVLNSLGKSDTLVEFVEDRKGHDQRYAINWNKINSELGWKPAVSFEEGLKRTIEWYKKNGDPT
ncbi:dTDP-glucose 4,6-dehydratase [Halalkalibacter urbisdiaboli]|uniref:dTDP-glucose 4,6-dehydratase n=1 Tax=Halalkalibacter urbisdiaboli TaxID=1960589 RepID=UPI000B42F0EC|nr:dTDP-glucose 4,6-dehydratase [Halalkalibacter urbisdiaboli]